MKVYTIVYPAPGLRADWLGRVYDAVKEHGTKVQTKGRGPGSLEPEETAGLDYRVLTGGFIKDHVTWLWDWFTSDRMVSVVSGAVGAEVEPSEHVDSAININFLEGNAARYELHTDGQPYSAVLMCHECNEETGGRLMLQDSTGEVIEVETMPGMLVIFDGSVVPHSVEPLKTMGYRISLPLVYTPLGIGARPEGLDEYLYTEEKA